MTEMDSLNAALSFWDWFSYAALCAVFIGVVGEAVLDFTSWVSPARHSKVGRVAVLMLIAGLGGEIIAHAKNSEYTGKITRLLNLQTGQAQERASRADERSLILARDVERLKAANLEQAEKIIDLGMQLATQRMQVSSVQTKVGTVETAVGSVQTMLNPLEIDPVDLKRSTRNLRRSLRQVTIIRLADPEAASYADKLAAALRKLRFVVIVEDMISSRYAGVIVCENNAGDVKVANALSRASVGAKIAGKTAKDRPEFCDGVTVTSAPRGLFGAVGGTADALITGSIGFHRQGTVIFVGRRLQ